MSYISKCTTGRQITRMPLVLPDMLRYIQTDEESSKRTSLLCCQHMSSKKTAAKACNVSLYYFCKLQTVLHEMSIFKGNRAKHCQRAKGRRGHWQSCRQVTNSQSHLPCSVPHIFPLVFQDSPCKWSHFSTEVIWQIDLWLRQNVNRNKIKLSVPGIYQQNHLLPK